MNFGECYCSEGCSSFSLAFWTRLFLNHWHEFWWIFFRTFVSESLTWMSVLVNAIAAVVFLITGTNIHGPVNLNHGYGLQICLWNFFHPIILQLFFSITDTIFGKIYFGCFSFKSSFLIWYFLQASFTKRFWITETSFDEVYLFWFFSESLT